MMIYPMDLNGTGDLPVRKPSNHQKAIPTRSMLDGYNVGPPVINWLINIYKPH